MKWLKILGFAAFCIPQCLTAQKTTANNNKPTCAVGAICFSGEVSAGNEFHKDLNDNFEFTLEGNWVIAVAPRHKEGNCDQFTSVVNPPYRAHNELEIDEQYGWTAEDEVSDSPREFSFVTSCSDYRVEFERLQLVL